MSDGTQVVDLTTARKNLSRIVDEVFLEGTSVVIAKRNIPLAKLVGVSNKANSKKVSKKKKKIDDSLFGIWKGRGKSTLELTEELRKKAWRGRDYGS